MCVIASLYLENQSILVKNRDRKYKAYIEVIHELRDGVEVLYIHDISTDWSEGLNEYGIGITNATLMVNQDEREGVIIKKRKNSISHDGSKIRHALSLTNIESVLSYLTDYKNIKPQHNGLKGITFVSTPDTKYVIEGTTKHTPLCIKVDLNQPVIRTNHGIYHPGAGYNTGIKKQSSFSRLEIAERELSKINKIDEVFSTLSYQYVKNNFLNPYRRESEHQIFTTGQILINLSTLTLQYNSDPIFCEFVEYKRLLPEGYDSKLKFELTYVEENNTFNNTITNNI
jgi:hypothetical protein